MALLESTGKSEGVRIFSTTFYSFEDFYGIHVAANCSVEFYSVHFELYIVGTRNKYSFLHRSKEAESGVFDKSFGLSVFETVGDFGFF